MADYYTIIAATETLSCTQKQFEELLECLGDEAPGDEAYHGFSIEMCHGEAFIFAEECGNPEDLPERFLEKLGQMLHEQGKPYLEFAMSFTCSKLRQDGFGGGYFRVTDKGKLVFAKIAWPEEK